MTAKKRSKSTKPGNGEPERVSLAPLGPIEALRGLLATPPDPKPSKPRKRPRKG